tara:strand:+ start:6724 stop:6924 length:201 start_codon:yes stop_codon:yes gene_type:complete
MALMILMLGLIKIIFCYVIITFPFLVLDKWYKVEIINNDVDTSGDVSPDNDGFFMAAMYQDMGNDL